MADNQTTIEMETEPHKTDTETTELPDDDVQNNGNSEPKGNKGSCCCKLSPWVKLKLLQTFTLCANIWMLGQSQISFMIIYSFYH